MKRFSKLCFNTTLLLICLSVCTALVVEIIIPYHKSDIIRYLREFKLVQSIQISPKYFDLEPIFLHERFDLGQLELAGVGVYHTDSNANNKLINSTSIALPTSEPVLVYEKFGENPKTIQSAPEFVDGSIIFQPRFDTIHSLSLRGKVNWEYKSTGQISQRGFRVFKLNRTKRIVFGEGRTVVCLFASNGKKCSDFGANGVIKVSGRVVTRPEVVGSDVFVTTDRGTFEKISIDKSFFNHKVAFLVPGGSLARLLSSYSGGRNWGGFAIDTEKKIAVISTSNPAPSLVGDQREGSNGYSSALVVYDISNMQVRCQFQDVIHDVWDLDIAMPPVLISKIQEPSVNLAFAVGKSGNVIMINTEDCSNVRTWRYAKAPPSDRDSERLSSIQPMLDFPDNLTGNMNTAVFDADSEPKWDFYIPPSTSYDLLVKNLHGGAGWGRPSFDGSNVYFTVSRDTSLIGLSLAETEPLPISLMKSKCNSCHGNGDLPSAYSLGRTLSQKDLSQVITQGVRAMPAVSLSKHELAEIIAHIKARRNNTNGDQIIRKPYAKLWGEKGSPLGYGPPFGEIFGYNVSTNNIEFRVEYGSSSNVVGLNFGQIFSTDNLLFVAGASNKAVNVYLKDTGKLLYQLENKYSVYSTPLVFSYNNEIYLFLVGSGGGTPALYASDIDVGLHMQLYKFAK
jgi:hypothetical protein